MSQDIIHVYCMPGMAANPSIFEHISLPQPQFQIHWLEWKIPLPNESLQAYAKRFTLDILHDNPVLMGVSFGGILVQEISKHIPVRKLIVVSSVTSKHQLPKRMKFAKMTQLHKLLPTQFASSVTELENYNLGAFIDKRIALYKKYMSVNDKSYLDWAIHQIIHWDQDVALPNTVQIHGDKDGVFTKSCQPHCHVIKGGTHVMIINKYKWFNDHLPNLILATDSTETSV